MFNKKALVILMILVLATTALAGCGSSADITVGSKNFTENILLGEMISILIEENTDLTVERKLNLGGTLVNFEALRNGDLDLYVDYTGTGLMAILDMDVINDPDLVYDIVQEEYMEQFGLKWMAPMGFNNTYAIAVREDTAKQYSLETLSDLALVSDELVLGSHQEFYNRPDGYPGLQETYGMNFKDTKAMEIGLKYQAIGTKDIDVTDAFATDGRLISYNLVVLEDDKQFFPPYHAAPVVRMDTLEEYPELEGILNSLGNMISDEEMQQMNYLVEEEGMDEAKVARDFLVQKGLIGQ